MNEIGFDLAGKLDIHPENIAVQSDGAGICVFIEVARGTDSKPIFDKVFDYIRTMKFSKKMVEVRTP